MNDVGKEWSLSSQWNQSLGRKNERPVEPRDRIYASELGRSDVDIFLKLMGETPTNPPNDRSYRKFDAGDLFEWFVRLVLIRSGIYIASQTPVKITLPDCIEVSGKLDFIAGGTPNFEQGQEEMKELIASLGLPDVFHRVSDNLIDYFKANYSTGLKKKVLEIKSVATYGFEKIEKTGKPLGGHDLQNFHYSFGLETEGSIVYICRDDLRMIEIPIMPNNEELFKRYAEKIQRVSKYYFDKQMPEPEPVVLFDSELGKFSKNFNVEYSPFLKKLYGIERPDEYDEMFGKTIKSWNGVMERIKLSKPMTAKNLIRLDEIKARGFDVDYVSKCARESKIDVGEETPLEE